METRTFTCGSGLNARSTIVRKLADMNVVENRIMLNNQMADTLVHVRIVLDVPLYALLDMHVADQEQDSFVVTARPSFKIYGVENKFVDSNSDELVLHRDNLERVNSTLWLWSGRIHMASQYACDSFIEATTADNAPFDFNNGLLFERATVRDKMYVELTYEYEMPCKRACYTALYPKYQLASDGTFSKVTEWNGKPIKIYPFTKEDEERLENGHALIL